MGFREAALLGFVLLLSGGDPCAATQNVSSETLDQTPHERADIPLPRAARPPLTYRLKTYQLRRKEPRKPEAGRLISEQLAPQVKPQELVKLVPGPDLNPPVKQESQVMTLVFDQRVPEPAASVALRCGEAEVTVEVKQNFLGNGQLIRPSDLTLGGCGALGGAGQVLRFQAALHGCGSTARMTEDILVYSFSLVYSPTPVGNTFILKTNPAEVVIECHYRRRRVVSSGALAPTWTPYASKVLAERPLRFSLQLMTEDWRSLRGSGVYFLSDVMHIEAAVLQGHHVPLRVFVDSCVASAGPDPDSQPRYPFISNHGCLGDAKDTAAKSYFMQRSREDKLHFQLKAFRFYRDHKNSVRLYITCRLKATKTSASIDQQHKSCSFLTEANRWVASGGDNKVCDCCDTSCGRQRWERSVAPDADTLDAAELLLEETLVLGPILLVDDVPLEQLHEVTEAASESPVGLLCGVGALLALLLLLLLLYVGAIVGSSRHKSTGHFVCT